MLLDWLSAFTLSPYPPITTTGIRWRLLQDCRPLPFV